MIEQSIRELSMDIPPGENRGGFLCPFCNGGDSRDKSFSIKVEDDGTILYKCHRVKCDAHGIVHCGPPSASRRAATGTAPKASRPVPPGPRRPLSDIEVATIYELYQIEYPALKAAEVEAADCVDIGERIVIPIEGPAGPDLRGYLRGYEYRELPPYTRRDKSRHYRLQDGLWAGCFGEAEHGLIAVEDTWSAIKIAQELPGYMGYALMGTYISIEHILEINRLSRNWYLCLDRDATVKAIKYKQQYRHLGDFTVCSLNRDMKYLDADEIAEVIR